MCGSGGEARRAISQGQHAGGRLVGAPQTAVVRLITQRSQVQIRPPLEGQEAPEPHSGPFAWVLVNGSVNALLADRRHEGPGPHDLHEPALSPGSLRSCSRQSFWSYF
jgi:hypothetical protein